MQISNNNITSFLNTTYKDRKQAESAQKNEQAKQALNTLLTASKNSTKEINDNKKANAKARLQEVAKRIQQLKLNFTGDPKILARMLASLVKELKQIIKDYGSALGSDGIGAAGYSDASIGITKTAAANETTSSADVNTQTQDAAVTQDTNDTSTTTEATEQSSEKPTQDTSEAANSNTQPADKTNENPVLKPKEEDEFVKMARKALEDLKTLFKIAKAAVKFTYNDKEGNEIIKDFEDDFKDAEKEFADIENKTNVANSGSLVSLVA